MQRYTKIIRRMERKKKENHIVDSKYISIFSLVSSVFYNGCMHMYI